MEKIALWLKENYLALVAPVLLLAVWEAASQLGLIRANLLPRPSVIAVMLVELLASGELLLPPLPLSS